MRDGRAVVESLLRVDFWRKGGGLDRPFWRGVLADDDVKEWREYGNSDAALAAIQWRRTVERTYIEGRELADGRFTELLYEDYVARPLEEMERLRLQLGLPPSPRLQAWLESQPVLNNMNRKASSLPAGKLRDIETIMAHWLSHYGYL